MKIDLHCHSYISDGTLSPEAVVKRAIEQKVDTLALTDHDTVDGIDKALEASKYANIKLIPGVEISCIWNKHTIHVVGLGIDITNPELNWLLKTMQKARKERGIKIGDRLLKVGISNAYTKAASLSKNQLVTRTHYARLLITEGYAKTMQDSFKKYLGLGKKCFIKGNWCEIKTAVDTIHVASGLAIIAHPLRYKMTNTKLNTLFKDFKNLGGDGIEVVNAGNNPDKTSYLARLSAEHKFLASTGSDFHTPGDFIELGKLPPIPKICKPVWEAQGL